MSSLEEAVKTLAGALDALEAKVDERNHDLSDQTDAVVAARRSARAARTYAGEASEELSTAISDLKSMLTPASSEEEAAEE